VSCTIQGTIHEDYEVKCTPYFAAVHLLSRFAGGGINGTIFPTATADDLMGLGFNFGGDVAFESG